MLLLFSCSVMSDSLWRYGLQRTSLRASLFFSISQGWFKLMPIESMMPSNHLILCCPLLFLPSVFPSIRVFSSELALRIRWPKNCSFSFSSSPSNEYSGLISYRTDCFDLAIQGTLKSLLQHQLESVNSLALSLLYGPTLTSIHDYWKRMVIIHGAELKSYSLYYM